MLSVTRVQCRYAYEYRDAGGGGWFRAYGNENWEFAANGLMAVRAASFSTCQDACASVLLGPSLARPDAMRVYQGSLPRR